MASRLRACDAPLPDAVKAMPRKAIGDRPMTVAERSARKRQSQQARVDEAFAILADLIRGYDGNDLHTSWLVDRARAVVRHSRATQTSV